jgi:hypothetical protein
MRLDPGGQQAIDQAVVVIEPLLVGLAAPIGEDARPGDREAIGLDAQRLEQFDILAIAVIAVAGDIAGAAIAGLALRVREDIPIGLPAPIFLDAALDLIGRRGAAPEEALRKASPPSGAAAPLVPGCAASTRPPSTEPSAAAPSPAPSPLPSWRRLIPVIEKPL